jgi:hypothetical protein
VGVVHQVRLDALEHLFLLADADPVEAFRGEVARALVGSQAVVVAEIGAPDDGSRRDVDLYHDVALAAAGLVAGEPRVHFPVLHLVRRLVAHPARRVVGRITQRLLERLATSPRAGMHVVEVLDRVVVRRLSRG